MPETTMAYETSYDVGLKPFNHDKHRGKWSSSMDFLYACIGQGFKIDAIFILPSILFGNSGIYALIPYFFILATCVIPIVFIQSFLGQFSSTGFISVFRIAPLFKGIGYVSLAVNITTLTYYSVFAAIPLFYFFHSLRPTLPWSCEGAKEWMEPMNETSSFCTMNVSHSTNTPSLRNHLKTMDHHLVDHPDGTFSWSLMICTFLIWIMVGTVLRKPIDVVGRFLRYSCLAVIGILCICVLRFAFLPNATNRVPKFFYPIEIYFRIWFLIPFVALSTLGPACNSILTMASYNNFKTNIFRYSWLMSFAQSGILFGIGMMNSFLINFVRAIDPHRLNITPSYAEWMEFMSIPTALNFLEMPHFWSLIFFGMMTFASLNSLVVQLISVLTSLFDEFEKLRPIKREVTLGAVGALALTSIYFCSNFGVTSFEHLMRYSTMTQMLLNFLLLVVVLWVYGRERLQRDINFMTSRTYSTWMVYVVRFIAPVFLAIGFITGIVALVMMGYRTLFAMIIIFPIVLLPWLLVPAYCIFKVMETSGMLKIRLKRCVKPTDWYPADTEDRLKYEETFSNTDISHQLTTSDVA